MKLNEQGIKKNISSGDFCKVYLIKGDEGYLKQHYSNQIVKKVVPQGLDGFNVHILKEESANADEISNCVESIPMMCDKNCVLVQDYDFDKVAEPEKEKMIEILSDLPSTSVLIFWMDSKGFSQKKASSKKILKLIDENGAVVDLNKRTANDLVSLIMSGVKKRNCTISRGEAIYFVSVVGNDMSTLVNELEKICAYANGTITREIIDEIATKTVEATAFKMVDALLMKKLDVAFQFLDILFVQKTEPVMICGAIISTYVDMYRAKVTIENGSDTQRLKKSFGTQYKSEFRIKNAINRSKKISKESLYKCLDYLSDADDKLKLSTQEKRIVLEELMIKLARA